MVTHLTTSPPVRCLNRAERTGSLVFNALWSYVEDVVIRDVDKLRHGENSCRRNDVIGQWHFREKKNQVAPWNSPEYLLEDKVQR
jgi:hypothetical protein